MITYFQKLSYKQKCHYALYSFIVLLVFIYFSNIRETIKLKQTKSELLIRNNNTIDPDIRLNDLLTYNEKLDAIIGSNISSEINTTEEILKHINNYAKKSSIKIQEYYPPFIYNSANYNLKLNHFILEGDFKDMLKLAYLFETEYKVGRFLSVEFNIETNKRTKRSKLLSHIYLQNILSTDE